MHLLDRLIRAVLIFCMMILCGYILIRTVTIAGENGMFQDSPVWSAIYRKLELYSLEISVPALADTKERTVKQDLTDGVIRMVMPVLSYQEQPDWEEEQQEEEYELILKAEAQAEEQKKPLDLEQWISERRQTETENKKEENPNCIDLPIL